MKSFEQFLRDELAAGRSEFSVKASSKSGERPGDKQQHDRMVISASGGADRNIEFAVYADNLVFSREDVPAEAQPGQSDAEKLAAEDQQASEAAQQTAAEQQAAEESADESKPRGRRSRGAKDYE